MRLGAGPAFPSKSLRSRPREVKIPALSLQRTERRGRGSLLNEGEIQPELISGELEAVRFLEQVPGFAVGVVGVGFAALFWA
jgi:hypothetical protein